MSEGRAIANPKGTALSEKTLNNTAQSSNSDMVKSMPETESVNRKSEIEYDREDDLSSEEGKPRKGPWLPRRVHDGILIFLLLAMLLWPWIFWGAIRARGGVQLSNGTAKLVTDNPHSTAFFVTLISNLIALIIDILFSFSVIRLAQEWFGMKRRTSQDVKVFHVALLSGARHQSWPWKMGEWKQLLDRKKWLPVLVLGVCVGTFTFVPASVSGLLTPVPYNRTASLAGTELDFSSTQPDCLAWFAANDLNNNCDWQFYKDVPYTTCLGENQMVDVLESGRGNILSLLHNNSESLTLSQLGGQDGIRVLGSIGGVLPMGPNGVPAFDTTTSPASPFYNEATRAGMISYNYTLEQQGLLSNISCIYDTQSPIRASRVPDNTTYIFQYNGTCEDVGMATVLPPTVVTFISVNSNNSLAYWACQSPPVDNQVPTYYVYLRGRTGAYNSTFSNMTCAVSPIAPAVYPITYNSDMGLFQIDSPVRVASTTLPSMIEHALVGLGGVVWEAQNWESNLVAESVITYAVKAFGITNPYQSQVEYLRLTEAMLQGILEYEASYIRLVYSTKQDPPSSCLRNITGRTQFTVLGWQSDVNQIGMFMPMFLITLFTLVILVVAIATTKTDEEYNDGDLLASLPLLRAGIEEWSESQDSRLTNYGRAIAVKEAGTEAGTNIAEAANEDFDPMGAIAGCFGY